MSGDDRIEALEKRVGELSSELEELRAEVDVLRASGIAGADHRPAERAMPAYVVAQDVTASPSRGPRPHEASPRERVAVEDWIGRYGAIAVALAAVLAGVGTLISWSIRRGYFGPTMRVAAGALIAAMLATAGLRLRPRGRQFGNALLAIALAVVHAVAWGAGPALGLVPSFVALAAAATASAMLALLAVREQDEMLFCVGLAGASMAPFVTSDGGDHILTLAVYGGAVHAAAARGIGASRWKHGLRLFTLSALGYGAVFAREPAGGIQAWSGAVLAALVLAGAALPSPAANGGWFVRVAAMLGGIAAVGFDGAWPLAVAIAAAFAAACSVALWRLRVQHAEARIPFVDDVMLPGALLLAAFHVIASSGLSQPWSCAVASTVAVAWAAAAAFGATRAAAADERDDVEGWSMLACASAAAAALQWHPWWHELAAVLLAVAAVGAATVWARAGIVAARLASPLLTAAGGLLMLAEMTALGVADYRTPFLSVDSAVAFSILLLAAAAAETAARRVASPEPGATWLADPSPAVMRDAPAAIAAVFAFLWIQVELEWAWSPAASRFLTIAYDGGVGLALVIAGMRAALPGLRHLGLALSAIGAVRTVGAAWDIPNTGLRIVLYLLVAAYALIVAYFYRKRPSQEAP